jgi:hypothetical protein
VANVRKTQITRRASRTPVSRAAINERIRALRPADKRSFLGIASGVILGKTLAACENRGTLDKSVSAFGDRPLFFGRCFSDHALYQSLATRAY